MLSACIPTDKDTERLNDLSGPSASQNGLRAKEPCKTQTGTTLCLGLEERGAPNPGRQGKQDTGRVSLLLKRALEIRGRDLRGAQQLRMLSAQADLCEFEASLDYRANSRTAKTTQRKPVSNNKTKQTNKAYFHFLQKA